MLKASSNSIDAVSYSSDFFNRQPQHYYVYLLLYLVLSLHAAKIFFCFEAFSDINANINEHRISL